MRRNLLTIIFLFMAITMSANDGFTVKGKITGLPAGQELKIVPIGVIPHKELFTTQINANGEFLFTGSIDGPALVGLQCVGSRVPSFFMLDNKSDITITAKAEEREMGKSGKIMTIRDFDVKGSSLYEQYKKIVGEKIFSMPKNEHDRLFQRYKNTFWGPVVLLMTEIPSSITKEEFEQMSPDIQKSLNGRLIHAYLYPDTIAIGEVIWPFQLKGDDGQVHEILDLVKKARYTLIDFWASWCQPCRAEMQNVKKYYDQWKDKGFNVISISVDASEADWRKAVEEEQMAWTSTNFLDRMGAADRYMIRFVPKLYLVDSEGRLIGEDLREGILKAKLTELFGE